MHCGSTSHICVVIIIQHKHTYTRGTYKSDFSMKFHMIAHCTEHFFGMQLYKHDLS